MDTISEFSVVESRETFGEQLKAQIKMAARNAPEITTNNKFGVDSDTYRLLLDTKTRMEVPGETATFDFMDSPNTVYVDNPHDYITLQKLALRQILKTNYGLTDKQLDSKKYQDFYADWYKANINYQQEHEFDHNEQLHNHGEFKTRFGVRFVKEKGQIKFYPDIDLKGTVDKKVFIEKILKGNKELSKPDKALLKMLGVK